MNQVRDSRSDSSRAYRWRPFIAFEDTNVVGNVYFARLISWQGRCREAFLAEHAPDVLVALAGDLRLVTISVACDYFEELRAFDHVELEMRLAERNGHKLRLAFDYWLERDALRHLAARGTQVVGCMRDLGNGALVPDDLPATLAAALGDYGEVGR